ncbi:MAG: aminoacyl-tRNA hydrolase [Crocinitomicaceae bacterium]|nr:MAG: aminoacyl-tRNA hydrolase [Crocinitomicaceae bacterium]
MQLNPHSLYSEIAFKTSRSGGAGGQHVNKVSTKVELIFNVWESKLLDEDHKNLISEKLSKRLDTEGALHVIVQTERSQLRNKKIALEKFHELIAQCFVVQKKRKPSKIPKAVKEKRLLNKKMKAEIKRLRSNNF